MGVSVTDVTSASGAECSARSFWNQPGKEWGLEGMGVTGVLREFLDECLRAPAFPASAERVGSYSVGRAFRYVVRRSDACVERAERSFHASPSNNECLRSLRFPLSTSAPTPSPSAASG